MMKMNPSWFIFFSTSVMGILILISSNNWFFTWMGFELSLMGFIPLFLLNSVTIEGIIKYFLIQATASATFFLTFLMSVNWLKSSILLLSMLLKLGLFPFIQWMPMVMATLPWMGCLILTTMQKMGPLMVLVNMSWTINANENFMMGALSILASGLMGYNQSMLRPLMAYSSISHTAWLTISSMINIKIFVIYMIIYFVTNMALMMNFNTLNMQKVLMYSKQSNMSMLSYVMLLSLAGLPPFLLFFMKVSVIMMLTNHVFILMLMITGTYLSIYYYLMVLIPLLTKNSVSKSPVMNNKMKLTLGSLIMLSMIILI